MTQPLDRTCRISHVGDLAVEKGEFWVENPFEMPEKGENLSAFERNRLYLNAGGLKFVNASFASACDIDADSRSAVAMDYDNDGDEDLLVGSVGGGAIRLFKNNFPKQNAIKVRLEGLECNKTGIGSRLILKVGDKKIVRDLFPANGFMGSGPPEIVFGVGQADQVGELSIRWPNGKNQIIKGLPVNHAVTVTEGKSEVKSTPFAK